MMAAVGGALGLFNILAPVVKPFLPKIIDAVEGLFGHSAQTGNKDGSAKMEAVLNAAQELLKTYANAGKIPSSAVVDPNVPITLANITQMIVDDMKSKGLLGPPADAPGPQVYTLVGTITPTPKL